MSVLVVDNTNDYPKSLIADCDSAALVFCSAAMGVGDGYWYKDSGLTDVACVTWDAQTLGLYRSLYPTAWSYAQADGFVWAAAQDRTWDIVSVDTPTSFDGDMFATLPTWTALAAKYAVVTVQGYNAEGDAGSAVPDGWTLSDCIQRAVYGDGRVFHWLVLTAG